MGRSGVPPPYPLQCSERGGLPTGGLPAAHGGKLARALGPATSAWTCAGHPGRGLVALSRVGWAGDHGGDPCGGAGRGRSMLAFRSAVSVLVGSWEAFSPPQGRPWPVHRIGPQGYLLVLVLVFLFLFSFRDPFDRPPFTGVTKTMSSLVLVHCSQELTQDEHGINYSAARFPHPTAPSSQRLGHPRGFLHRSKKPIEIREDGGRAA